MARGDHPMRTPFYGVLLIAGAMVGATVAKSQAPLWLQVVVYVIAVPAALVGFVLTLRDYGR